MSKLITLEKAISLIKAGKTVEAKEVDLGSGRVSAVDALRLHRHGIEVEEDQIYYDDSQIAYDPDFDDQEWGDPLPASAQMSLDLTVPLPVKEWIEGKKINLPDLITNLLISQMASDQIINQE